VDDTGEHETQLKDMALWRHSRLSVLRDLVRRNECEVGGCKSGE